MAVPGAPREQQLYLSAHGQARPARAHPHATLPTPCFAGLECGLSSSQPFAPAPGSRAVRAARQPGSRLEGDRIPERRRAAGTYLGPLGTRTQRRTAVRPPAAGAARLRRARPQDGLAAAVLLRPQPGPRLPGRRALVPPPGRASPGERSCSARVLPASTTARPAPLPSAAARRRERERRPQDADVSRLGRHAIRWLGLDCCTFFFVRCIFGNKKKSPTLHTTSSASEEQKSGACRARASGRGHTRVGFTVRPHPCSAPAALAF